MGRGKFKGKPTGRRQFSTPEEMLAGTSSRPRTFKKEEAEVEFEEERSDEESEESSEEESDRKKGTQGVIEIENPNMARPKTLKAKDTGGARKKRKTNPDNFRTRNLNLRENAFGRHVFVGSPVDVYMLASDDPTDPENANDTTALAWSLMDAAESTQEMGAYFASMIGVFSHELQQVMMGPLAESNARVNVLSVPSETDPQGWYPLEDKKHGYKEHLLLLGISLMLPFKNVNELNYTSYIRSRVKALAGKLGMGDRVGQRFRYHLNLRQAQDVKSIFGSSVEVKREIIRYLMWGAKTEGALLNMCRYVLSIIEWSEMSLVCFINNEFVNSNSPVMQRPVVANEVYKFVKAMKHICRSRCPQFFKFFCQPHEEILLSRANYPTLGAVAYSIMSQKSKTGSINNFVRTAEEESPIVKDLIALHNKHCSRKVLDGRSNHMAFIQEDGDYDALLEEDDEDLLHYD